MTLHSEIPPYQGIDLALGLHTKGRTEPVRGWAISHPVLGTEMFESEEDADRRISEIACSGVQWPHHISKFMAWIHQEGNRKHWTPR